MNQTGNNYENTQYPAEIDLLDLFAIIWKGKWLIVGLTGIAAVLAFLVIRALPALYEIETVLDGPSQNNLQALQPSTLTQSSEAAARASTAVREGMDYQVQALAPNGVYAKALAHANSLYVQKLFWEQQGRELAGVNLEAADVASVEADSESFRNFVDSLAISAPEGNNNSLSRITLRAEQPTQGVEMLAAYLSFINNYTITGYIDTLIATYQSRLQRLAGDYESLRLQEKIKIEDELIRLEEAHAVAESLGIVSTPYEQVENVQLTILDNREYLLGTTVLSQEIKALQARQDKPLEAFVPELRQMRRWKEQMEGDLQRLRAADDDVEALVIVSPPESSLTPVAPNKALIFVAVVFAAGLLSLMLVFIRHGVRVYRARSEELTQ